MHWELAQSTLPINKDDWSSSFQSWQLLSRARTFLDLPELKVFLGEKEGENKSWWDCLWLMRPCVPTQWYRVAALTFSRSLVDGWVCGSLGMLIGPGRSAGRWSVNGYVVNGKGNACEIICVIEAHTLITPFVPAITSARRNHSLFCHIAMHCHDIHSGKTLCQLIKPCISIKPNVTLFYRLNLWSSRLSWIL